MTRVSAIIAMLLLAACGHQTIRRTSGSASPAPSAALASPTPSTSPGATKAAAPSPSAVTPAPQQTYTQANGIDGKVVAGPTCPVERVGHPCPPRPVDNATVTARGPQTKTAHTNSDGKFSLRLTPGTYDVSAEARGVFGCRTQHVQVVAHRYTHITIDCDTGMR